jgi:hypothetical protein
MFAFAACGGTAALVLLAGYLHLRRTGSAVIANVIADALAFDRAHRSYSPREFDGA